jgi:hypothetical protein
MFSAENMAGDQIVQRNDERQGTEVGRPDAVDVRGLERLRHEVDGLSRQCAVVGVRHLAECFELLKGRVGHPESSRFRRYRDWTDGDSPSASASWCTCLPIPRSADQRF